MLVVSFHRVVIRVRAVLKTVEVNLCTSHKWEVRTLRESEREDDGRRGGGGDGVS